MNSPPEVNEFQTNGAVMLKTREDGLSGQVTEETRSSATAEKQRVSCPHGGRGLGPPAHSPFAPSGYTYAYGRIRKPQRTYVKRAVRKAHLNMHLNMNRAFEVIQGHPY